MSKVAPIPCPSSSSSTGLPIAVHVCCHPCALDLDLAGTAARQAGGSRKGGVMQAAKKIVDKIKGRKVTDR